MRSSTTGCPSSTSPVAPAVVEWLQFIDRGIQLVGENATMVPGHGAIGKAADVRRFRTYFTNMQDNVHKAIAAGKTREQAMDEITVPAYANLPGGAARIRHERRGDL